MTTPRKPFRYQRVRLARGDLRRELMAVGDVALTEYNTGTALLINVAGLSVEQTVSVLSHEAIHLAIMNTGLPDEQQEGMHDTLDRATAYSEFLLSANGIDMREAL